MRKGSIQASTELCIYPALQLKEMLGSYNFLKGKNCKTIRNNGDRNMKYCTDILNSGSEVGSQRYMEAGKLQEVNMHLLALGHWAVQTACCTDEPHRVISGLGMVFTLHDLRIYVWSLTSCLLGWQLCMLGKLHLNCHFHSPSEQLDSSSNIQPYKL